MTDPNEELRKIGVRVGYCQGVARSLALLILEHDTWKKDYWERAAIGTAELLDEQLGRLSEEVELWEPPEVVTKAN